MNDVRIPVRYVYEGDLVLPAGTDPQTVNVDNYTDDSQEFHLHYSYMEEVTR